MESPGAIKRLRYSLLKTSKSGARVGGDGKLYCRGPKNYPYQ